MQLVSQPIQYVVLHMVHWMTLVAEFHTALQHVLLFPPFKSPSLFITSEPNGCIFI